MGEVHIAWCLSMLIRTAHILFYAECSSPSTPTLPIHYSNLCNLSSLCFRFTVVELGLTLVLIVFSVVVLEAWRRRHSNVSKQKASLEKEIHHTVGRKIRRKVDDEINNRLSLGTLFFQPNFLVTVEGHAGLSNDDKDENGRTLEVHEIIDTFLMYLNTGKLMFASSSVTQFYFGNTIQIIRDFRSMIRVKFNA
ncbi:hypothetical protein YC2023_029884 [Brassica napus]